MQTQGVHRIYRHGQKKDCYIYRLIGLGTMEEKIYKRQVTKISLSKRVLDAKSTHRHYEENDLAQLYNTENIEPNIVPPQFELPKDKLLKKLLQKHNDIIYKYHTHDSLLQENVDEHLTQIAKRLAWEEFENAKKFEKKATKVLKFPCLQYGLGMFLL